MEEHKEDIASRQPDGTVGNEDGSRKKKKWANPIRWYMAYRASKRLAKEMALLKREEQMNQDLERYLMGIEEHRCWVAFQLGHINFERMKKRAVLNRLVKREEEKQKQLEEEWDKENGLQYFLGSIQSFRRWQNSPAKFLDFKGHQGAVTSCRLSPCLQYLLSCSEDKTLKIWNTETGECLKTFSGHSKVVNDADMHFDFKMFHRVPCIVSASGDCTLKIWNSSDTRPMTTLYGHEHAVYRVAFAPDGKSLVSCSEDRTVRTWCFPEGYNLYIYRGHASGVLCVRFSPSGRFFASGSDYGERKLLLWNAKMPKLTDPSQFPHIFFWTPEGLIKKVVIRKTIPRPNFWLMQTQLHWLNDDDLEIWPGEISDIDDGNNDDDDETEPESEGGDESDGEAFGTSSKGKESTSINSDDVRELKGITLRVTHVGSGGDKSEATEYNPGGFLIVSIKSSEETISEAFFDAMSKSGRHDIFLSSSGQKLGKFELDAPVPWLPMKKIIDPKGRVKYYRDVPPGMRMSKDQRSAIFRESAVKISYKMQLQLAQEERKEKKEPEKDRPKNADPNEQNDEEEVDNIDYLKNLDVVWTCPQEENMGAIVVVVNVKLKSTSEWLQLRYSLKESPIRVNVAGEVKVREIDTKRAITFDQEERHRQFWKHIRDKDYKAAASFIDRRAIAHTARGSIYRRFRIMNLMVAMFDESPWMILHSPFIFRQGVTKSVVLCESGFDEGGNDNEEPTEEEEEEAVEEENFGPAPAGEDPRPGTPREGVPDSQGNDNTDDGSREQSNGDYDGDQPRDAVFLDEPEEEPIDEAAETETPMAGEGISTSKVKSSEAAPMSPLLALSILKHRPTTKAQPKQIVLIKDIKRKAFESTVELLAEAATEAIIRAEMEWMHCAFEMGLRIPHYWALALIRDRLREEEIAAETSPLQGLLALCDRFDIEGFMDADMIGSLFELQSSSVWKPEIEDVGTVSGVTEVLQSDMIKTGKYGPDIDDYSMPLPQFFPARTGNAKYALKPAIVLFESQLHRLEAERLPTTLAEVHVPTIKERATALYHRLNHTDQKLYREGIETKMRVEMRRQALEDNIYIGTRRPTFMQLPGLAPHYPNTSYPVPAVVPPENDFVPPQLPKNSFMDRMFGRPVLRSALSPPVGRKPAHLTGLTFAQWSVRAEKLMKKSSAMNHQFAFDKVHYQADVLGNLLAADEPDQERARGFWRNGLRFKRKKKKAAMSRAARLMAILPNVLTDGYPKSFYTGRRGSFPVAPGLVDFLETQRAKSGPVMEDEQALVVGEKRVEGLVRRFRINGFELAHHGAVNDLVFAPSEARLVTAGGDGLLKIWDPRDGSFVRSLEGHVGEVRSVQYTANEQFLVSCGADMKIIVWSMLTQTIQRVLKGHVDVVNSLSMTTDCAVIFTASHDMTLKSWYTTPRAPATPAPPRVVSVTHNCAMISWTAPPCFNLDLTAFHLQYRVGIRERWRPAKSTNILHSGPEEEADSDEEFEHASSRGDKERAGLCVAPHLRTRTIDHLIPATYYQFRVRAENRMGLSDWSQPSPLTRTDFGLPEPPERPLVVRVDTEFIEVFWFTANPETFGSASTAFHIEYQGCGHEFSAEESAGPGPSPKATPSRPNLLELPLDEASRHGELVLHAFELIHDQFLRSKDKLRKSEVFSVHTRQSAEDAQAFAVSKELPSETIFHILERSRDHTHLGVSAVFRGLHPGFLYSFRVRGVNRVGCGPWSAPTLTIGTKPTLPNTPPAPRLLKSTLRSLTLQWDPPADDGGTAITGYVVHLMNSDKYIEMGRSTVTYTWDGLFPGRSYRMRVRALNSIGSSPFSQPNSEEESYTSTAPPEQPSPAPLAVAGSWNELRYEVVAPYNNGAPIESMCINYRIITPFSVGSWETPFGHPSYPVRHLLYRSDDASVTSDSKGSRSSAIRRTSVGSVGSKASETSLEVPEEVIEVVSFVDTRLQQDALEQTVRELEMLKSSAGFNPNKSDKSKFDDEIEALISRQKPGGSRLRFRLMDLQPDSMYEVRVAFSNLAGQGPFSESSHRAKTNKASPPSACAVPVVVTVGVKHMVLEVTVPPEGGAAVRFFQIEYMDLDDSNIVKLRLSRNAMDQDKTVQYRLENLRPGGSYIVRCCAESSVGPGPYSPWTKEIELLSGPSTASYLVPGITSKPK